MKVCFKCKKKKDESEFSLSSGSKDGLNSWCKNCNKESNWKHVLHYRYNITAKQYELMLKSQNGVCIICGKSETKRDRSKNIQPLSVDHNHLTGKVRGLICNKCNVGLGNFNDNPELLRKAAFYLEGQLWNKVKLS